MTWEAANQLIFLISPYLVSVTTLGDLSFRPMDLYLPVTSDHSSMLNSRHLDTNYGLLSLAQQCTFLRFEFKKRH